MPEREGLDARDSAAFAQPPAAPLAIVRPRAPPYSSGLPFDVGSPPVENILKVSEMLSKIGALSACGLLAATLVFAQPASAAVVVYSGFDPQASSISTKPKSDAARAAFLAAINGQGETFTNGFETGPTGQLPVYDLGGGGSFTGSDNGKKAQIVRTTPLCQFNACGGNTTVGGKNHLGINGGTVTFSFADPIQAFGAYFTGGQLPGLILTFNDGTSRSIDVPGQFGADYVGFTDFGRGITQITFNATRDQMAIDDITFQLAPGGVPEPATWALMIAGFGMAGATLRTRRRAMA